MGSRRQRRRKCIRQSRLAGKTLASGGCGAVQPLGVSIRRIKRRLKGSIGLPGPGGLRSAVIETGAGGVTIVKETSINAAILDRIATGPGSTCLSEANTINAPTQQICQ